MVDLAGTSERSQYELLLRPCRATCDYKEITAAVVHGEPSPDKKHLEQPSISSSRA